MSSESEIPREPKPAENRTDESATTVGQGSPNISVSSGSLSAQPPVGANEIICKKEKTRFEKFKDGMEVVGILVLIIYTVFTGLMYCANKKAADAAEDAASTAKESLTSVQRAFLTFEGIKSQSFFQRSPFGQVRILGISATWENSGTTPATKVIQAFQIDTLPEEPNDQRFKGKNTNYEVGVIAPKGSKDTGIINEPELLFFGDQMNTPPGKLVTVHLDKKIFLWGWILYRDVFFPKTETHLTEFCEWLESANYTAPPKPQLSSGFTFNFTSCHQHNCTDEDCKDYRNIVSSAPQ